MAYPIGLSRPSVLKAIIIALIGGMALSAIGLWLVYLGFHGEAISLFGQHITATMVGVPAIFIGGVIIAGTLRQSIGIIKSLEIGRPTHRNSSGGAKYEEAENREESKASRGSGRR